MSTKGFVYFVATLLVHTVSATGEITAVHAGLFIIHRRLRTVSWESWVSWNLFSPPCVVVPSICSDVLLSVRFTVCVCQFVFIGRVIEIAALSFRRCRVRKFESEREGHPLKDGFHPRCWCLLRWRDVWGSCRYDSMKFPSWNWMCWCKTKPVLGACLLCTKL